MIWNREPALFFAFIAAAISLAAAFGFKLTPEQVAGINAVVAAVFGLVIRSKVSPTDNGA